MSAHTISTADEGGETRMSGGIPWITLPAGYLGSSLIGACLIACGFDTNASKIACLVLAAFFLFTLWWARRNWLYVSMLAFPSIKFNLFWNVGSYSWNVWLDCFVLFCRRGRSPSDLCKCEFFSCLRPSTVFFPDPVHWCHVRLVCSLGHDW